MADLAELQAEYAAEPLRSRTRYVIDYLRAPWKTLDQTILAVQTGGTFGQTVTELFFDVSLAGVAAGDVLVTVQSFGTTRWPITAINNTTITLGPPSPLGNLQAAVQTRSIQSLSIVREVTDPAPAAELVLLKQIIPDWQWLTGLLVDILAAADLRAAAQELANDAIATGGPAVPVFNGTTFDDVSPGDLDLAGVTGPLSQSTAFERVMAVALAPDLTSTLTGETLAQLKDRLVDARLRERGWSAVAVKEGASAADKGQAGAELVLTRRLTTYVTAAFGNRKRTDLPTAIGAQIDNLVAIVEQAVGDDPEAMKRMWVLDWEIMSQPLLELAIPGITAAAASSKRGAIRARIGVPVDRSLRATRRAYAVTRNRARFLSLMLADLQRHTATATDPSTEIVLGDATSITQALSDATAALFTPLDDRLSELGDARPNDLVNHNPDDNQTTAQAVAADEGFAPDSRDTRIQIASTDLAGLSVLSTPVLAATTTKSAAPTGAMTPNDTVNVTALFESDFQDFRRTGIAMPLALLRSSEESNGNLLSFFYVIDDGTSQQGSFHAPTTGGAGANYYNHFMLQSVTETHVDKYQVADTLGHGWVGFGFGKAPQVWSIQGQLLNDMFSDQLARFREIYDRNLRISVLAKGHKKLALMIPAAGIIVYGYGLNLQLATDARDGDLLSGFVMQILVSSWQNKPLITWLQNTDKPDRTLPEKITTAAGGVVRRGVKGKTFKSGSFPDTMAQPGGGQFRPGTLAALGKGLVVPSPGGAPPDVANAPQLVETTALPNSLTASAAQAAEAGRLAAGLGRSGTGRGGANLSSVLNWS